jgi:hypothetical protein
MNLYDYLMMAVLSLPKQVTVNVIDIDRRETHFSTVL